MSMGHTYKLKNGLMSLQVAQQFLNFNTLSRSHPHVHHFWVTIHIHTTDPKCEGRDSTLGQKRNAKLWIFTVSRAHTRDIRAKC